MTAQHTQGRLVSQEGGFLLDADGFSFAATASGRVDNARRLAACWNAMQFVTTEQIEAFGEASGLVVRENGAGHIALKAERDQLRAELDQARALLTEKFDLPSDPVGAVAVAADRLVSLTEIMGVVLTITQRPLLPLAMGNYETTIGVRPARGS